nr:ZmpA/ZmpB/ZmpC family metallo-endopeptidase-related protein [uncultured Mediterraneibacter sp.]
MRKIKRAILLCLSCMIFGVACMSAGMEVQAAESLSGVVSQDKTSLKEGETVTLTLKFDAYQEIEKGINAYQATLVYNRDAFEEVTAEDFVTKNGWEKLKYNQETGEFVAIKRAGSKEPEEVATVTLQVKSNAKAGIEKVQIGQIVTSEGKRDIEVKDASVSVEIVRDQSKDDSKENPDDGSKDDSKDNPDDSSKDDSKDTPVDDSKDESKGDADKGKTTPTGDTTNWWFWFGLILVEAGVVFYLVKVKKISRNRKFRKAVSRRTGKFLILAVIAAISLQTAFTVAAAAGNFASKGEVNGDKKVDYDDVELLELYLIHQATLDAEGMKNADVNSDGAITVTDLTLLIQKLEKTLDYTVTLTDPGQDTCYLNKGQDVRLKLYADVSYDGEIEKVVIDGQEYAVTRESGSLYTVKVKAGDAAGLKEYKITEAVLTNGKRVPAELSIKCEVLKDAPSIGQYTTEPKTDKMAVAVTVQIKDEDKSMTSAAAMITNEAGEEIQREQLAVGENTFEVPVEEGKKYKVHFTVEYNLSSGKLEGQTEDHSGILQEEKDLEYVLDYQWTLSEVKAYKDGTESTSFAKNESIWLGFQSSNVTDYEPEYAVINGKTYPVTKTEQGYRVEFGKADKAGDLTLTLEEVILSNGKKFEVKEENQVTVSVLKEKPSVSEINLTEDTEKETMTAEFEIKDPDGTMTSAYLVLLDENGNEIAREKAEAGKNSLTLKTAMSAKYQAKLIVSYNISGKEEVKDTVLAEKEIEAQPKAVLKNITADTICVEKGTDLTIRFAVDTNQAEWVEKIRVNHTDCIVTRLDDGTYQFTYAAGTDSGIKELDFTKVIFADGKEADVTGQLRIEVLKDRPKLENYTQKDSLEDGKVTISFDITDPDQAFLSGKVVLTKTADGSKTERTINVGNNELEFSVEEDEIYSLEVLITYDRSLNQLDGQAKDAYKVTDEVVKTEEVELIGDYKLTVSNLATLRGETASKYFEKKEAVTLEFDSTNVTQFVPEKAVVSGTEYPVVNNNGRFRVQVDGEDTAGKVTLAIEKITLSNGRQLEISADNTVDIEILKSLPEVADLTYKEKKNDQVDVTFQVNDQDKALESGQVVILDENRQQLASQEIQKGENTLTFTKNDGESYFVKVTASYDRDSNALENGQNEYQNEVLLEEEIVTSVDRKIEMKDVQEVTVYEKKRDGSGYGEVTDLRLPYLQYYPDNYLAKVKMKDLPAFYAKIKSCRTENGQVYLILDYENAIHYTSDGGQENTLEVLYGDNYESGGGKSNSFAQLMSEIKRNPTGTFNLTMDYDASEYEGDKTSLAGENFVFQGTINGNGHKIYNLTGPLFNEIDKNSEIKNLVLENVYMANKQGEIGQTATTRKGALANEVYSGTVIENVHVRNMTLVTTFNGNACGGLIGRAQGGVSTIYIRNCSVTGLKISGGGSTSSEAAQIGGIVGLLQDAVIENCYVEGEITGSSAIGGIAGEINANQDADMKREIRNCIAKVELSRSGMGGIVGAASSNVVLENNICLSKTNQAYGLYSWGNISQKGENISYSKTEAKEKFSADTLKKLNFDSSIWKDASCSYEKLPALKNDDPRNVKDGEVADEDTYIPDYQILKKRTDYEKEKEVLYSNLYKLMPFYDSKYLVLDGKRISKDHVLNQKKIQTVLAFNAQGEVQTYLTEENYNQIQAIRVIFEDGTTEKYSVTYKYVGTEDPAKTYGRIAMYRIDDLGVEYTYDGYILKQDLAVIDELASYIGSMDYDTDLNSLYDLNAYNTRGYNVLKKHFNEVVQSDAKARDLVLNLAANVDGYSLTQDNEILNWVVSQQIEKNAQFKKLMYAYNYYSRFYGVEMGGTTLSDLMMFEPSLYRDNLTLKNIVDDFWNSENKSTHQLAVQFRNNLGRMLGVSSQGDLVERGVSAATDYTDMNQWFREYFRKGNLLVEVGTADHPDADYQGWTQLKKQPTYMMNILTMPENSTFMLSVPGNFLIGSQMVYLTDPTDEAQQQALIDKLTTFGGQMANFYNNALGIIDVSYLNKYADIMVDKYDVNVYGLQADGKCTDPFHVNFNDPLHLWFNMSGASAYATDGMIQYSYPAINYSTWTHEIGHNQSYKFFFKGNGFRPVGGNNNGNLGTEDYTDGHTSQGSGDGDVNWNLSFDYTPDKLVTTNLTPERINTVEKLNSYYKGMFEAVDLMDYAEAEAFLKLTPAEQAAVAVQAQYPNSNNLATVRFKKLEESDFEKMNLQTVDDLWDNRIMIRPGVKDELTKAGDGEYGSEGMYIRRWYQPYNDSGRTYSWGFTYTTWPMLGEGGYENGYLTWYTGKSQNDLDAIRKITKDSTMTWEKYKKNRYKKMADSLDTNGYLDKDSLIESYVTALKLDAANQDRNVTASTNVRRANYHYLKRVTNDFRTDVLGGTGDVIHITSAEELVTQITRHVMAGSTDCYTGSYVLDNDIDLSTLPANGETLISGIFMGRLDGQGHKLSGNTAPLFENIKFGYVTDLTLENSAIQSARAEKIGMLACNVEYSTLEKIVVKDGTIQALRETGAVAGRITSSSIQDVHATGVTVNGSARVGTFAGYVDKSQILESSANGESSGTGSAVGGFAGEVVGGSVVRDSYSVGRAKGAGGSDDVGGFVGYVNASTVKNCFSNARAEGRSGVAGFTGQVIGTSSVEDNLTLANQFTGYKFDGRTSNTVLERFSGNYEKKEAVGTSTRDRGGVEFDGKIDEAENAQIQSETFYTGTLGWSDKVWDFSAVSKGGVPKLRNLDPNDNSISTETYSVSNGTEFVANVTANPYARFILTSDIDLTGLGTIPGEFLGELEGNGHKITGSTAPIFTGIKQATIGNLIVDGSTIQLAQDEVGALAMTSNGSAIENVHVVNVAIEGAGNRVGGIVGSDEGSTFSRCSSTGSVSATGDEVGGLAGKMTKTTVENCYTKGSVTGSSKVGGMTGATTDATITYCYSAASVTGSEATAGFIGVSDGNSNVRNNLTLGNQSRQYKFDGATATDAFGGYQNNFEYEENRGIAVTDRTDVTLTGKISVASKGQVTDVSFYTGTLGWKEEIWDLSAVGEEKTPKLKELDPNEPSTIAVYKGTIRSVDEFASELAAHPEGEFSLENDLDFGGNTYTIGSVVVPGTFHGVLHGNGHTIRNLNNATLFEQFNGEATGLTIENVNYGAVYYTGAYAQYVWTGKCDRSQSTVAVFAKQSRNALFEDISLHHIVLFGADRVAGLTAVDMDSDLRNVRVTEGYINVGKDETEGSRSALLVGEKTGGTIQNCYVQGEFFTRGTECGGIVGAARGNAVIEETVASTYGSCKNAKNLATTGLFAGHLEENVKVRNSASIGMTATGETDYEKMGKFYGTANIDNLENCYENADHKGTSYADGVHVQAVENEQMKTLEFYTNVLGLDGNIWNLKQIEERYYTESVEAHGQTEDAFPLLIFLER